MKFQRIIDATLRAQQRLPSPLVPTDELAERERGFSERAKEIERLRQTGPGPVAEMVPISMVFEVVRHRGHWRTFHGNKHSSGFPDQGSAVAAAKSWRSPSESKDTTSRSFFDARMGTKLPKRSMISAPERRLNFTQH